MSNKRIEELRAAYAAGIPPVIATDVSEYLDMTLREIGEEWIMDPIKLLAALAAADEVENGKHYRKLGRREGETFTDYMNRALLQ
jgi:hypothetical protein